MGIKQGDVIISINYNDIKNPDEFMNAVSALNPGDKIVISIVSKSPWALLTVEGTDRPDFIESFLTGGFSG